MYELINLFCIHSEISYSNIQSTFVLFFLLFPVNLILKFNDKKNILPYLFILFLKKLVNCKQTHFYLGNKCDFLKKICGYALHDI